MRLHQEGRSPGKVVAVVDRTANINDAAEALVTACFSFGGRSPYSPDLVLVNEFIKKSFLMALIQASVSFSASASKSQGDEERLEKETEEGGGLQVIFSLGRGKIVEADKLYDSHYSNYLALKYSTNRKLTAETPAHYRKTILAPSCWCTACAR